MGLRRFAAAALVGALALAACGSTGSGEGSAGPGDGDVIEIATTTGMVADVARNVGGERVEVTALMGPGIDPHLYTPTASDVDTLAEADIVFYNGIELEGRMTDLLDGLERQGRTAVAVAETIDEASLLAGEDASYAFDPHVWFDVAMWSETIEPVEATLREADPDHAAVFAANADAYRAELAELDDYVTGRVAEIPESTRVLVTAHDAFRYFGAAYGIEVRGLQGISTATEAGAGDVRDLASFLCERRIPAIFVESSIPPATVEAVQEAARSQGCDVELGGELFSDAMGDEGTPEGTYVGMVTHNVDTITEALAKP